MNSVLFDPVNLFYLTKNTKLVDRDLIVGLYVDFTDLVSSEITRKVGVKDFNEQVKRLNKERPVFEEGEPGHFVNKKFNEYIEDTKWFSFPYMLKGLFYDFFDEFYSDELKEYEYSIFEKENSHDLDNDELFEYVRVLYLEQVMKLFNVVLLHYKQLGVLPKELEPFYV